VTVHPLQGEGDRDAQRRGGGASPQTMPPNILRARKLRREMSYPEVLLWQRLRGSPMGIRFRRQHPIGQDYTADFYCSAARLVIEVDGESHALPTTQRRDETRDSYMRSHGLAVVRVTVSEILNDADRAADAIITLAAAPHHHRALPDGPPPRSGEDQGKD
jgi:very-short-patch-repair endonuclease